MTTRQALEFVRKHGLVLESASGVVPSLAQIIAGEPIRGSWWGHARSHEIYAATCAIRASNDVLICRLINGKVTYVHRRLWPYLVRLESRFPRKCLAWIREKHTTSGRHVIEECAFPKWVPSEVAALAAQLTEEESSKKLQAAL